MNEIQGMLLDTNFILRYDVARYYCYKCDADITKITPWFDFN